MARLRSGGAWLDKAASRLSIGTVVACLARARFHQQMQHTYFREHTADFVNLTRRRQFGVRALPPIFSAPLNGSTEA